MSFVWMTLNGRALSGLKSGMGKGWTCILTQGERRQLPIGRRVAGRLHEVEAGPLHPLPLQAPSSL